MTTLTNSPRSLPAALIFSPCRVSLRWRMRRPVEDAGRRFFAAEEGLVGPGVVPIAVATAILDADVAQIGVDERDRRRAVVVVDHIGVAVDRGVLEQDAVAVADEAAAPQIGDRRLDIVLRLVGERLVLVGEIDL